MPVARVAISLTETVAFRRLVDFVEQVEEHADEQCDIALSTLVDDCRQDLLDEMSGD